MATSSSRLGAKNISDSTIVSKAFDYPLEEMYKADIKRLLNILEDCTKEYMTMLGGLAQKYPEQYGMHSLEEKGLVTRNHDFHPKRPKQYVLTDLGKEYYDVLSAFMEL